VAAVSQPAVKFVWYDGLKDGRPNAPYELLALATEESRASGVTKLPASAGDKKPPPAVDDPSGWDLVLVGDAGHMLFRRGSTDWIVSPATRAEQFADVPRTIPRVDSIDAEWIAACRGGPKPLSSFDYAGPFTEMVLLGTLAARLNRKLTWDAAALKVTGTPEADELIRRTYRPGWSLPLPPGVKVGG
jgi:hypothetical protein